jgi:hypothetical protein
VAWRVLLLIVAVPVLTAAGCEGSGTPTEPRPATERTEHVAVKRMLITLSDLPAGYRIGESGCGDLLTEGKSPKLSELSVEEGVVRCGSKFQLLYAAGDRRPAAPVVESQVAVFSSEDGAEAGLALAEEILYHFTALGGGKRAREVRSPVRLANATRMFRSGTALVAGRPGPGSAVVWRSGRIVGTVVVGGLRDRAGDSVALSLARTQQQRIESPRPPKPSEQDDREVALDNPRLGIDVYWLGGRFTPGGDLPPLTLFEAVGLLPPGGGPGNVVKIDYSTGQGPGGVTLDLWKPAAWKRFRKTELGRLVWDSPCAEARRLRLPRGEAVIYSGYVSRQQRPCPRNASDRFLAHVYLDDVVVAVNMPYCFACVARGAPGSSDPYNSIEGMEAIARGLRPRSAGG